MEEMEIEISVVLPVHPSELLKIHKIMQFTHRKTTLPRRPFLPGHLSKYTFIRRGMTLTYGVGQEQIFTVMFIIARNKACHGRDLFLLRFRHEER